MRTKITFPTDNMPPSHNGTKRASKPRHAPEWSTRVLCRGRVVVTILVSLYPARDGTLLLTRSWQNQKSQERYRASPMNYNELLLLKQLIFLRLRCGSQYSQMSIHTTRATPKTTQRTRDRGSLQHTWSSQVAWVTVRMASPPFSSSKHSLPFMPKSVKLLERGRGKKRGDIVWKGGRE